MKSSDNSANPSKLGQQSTPNEGSFRVNMYNGELFVLEQSMNIEKESEALAKGYMMNGISGVPKKSGVVTDVVPSAQNVGVNSAPLKSLVGQLEHDFGP